MVQSIITLGNREDRVLNIIKAQYGLKNKSQAVALVTQIYADSFLEPELIPKFVDKLKKIDKEQGIPFNSIEDLRRQIEG